MFSLRTDVLIFVSYMVLSELWKWRQLIKSITPGRAEERTYRIVTGIDSPVITEKVFVCGTFIFNRALLSVASNGAGFWSVNLCKEGSMLYSKAVLSTTVFQAESLCVVKACLLAHRIILVVSSTASLSDVCFETVVPGLYVVIFICLDESIIHRCQDKNIFK